MKNILSKVLEIENSAAKKISDARSRVAQMLIEADTANNEKLRKAEEENFKTYTAKIEEYRELSKQKLSEKVLEIDNYIERNSKENFELLEKGEAIVFKILTGNNR